MTEDNTNETDDIEVTCPFCGGSEGNMVQDYDSHVRDCVPYDDRVRID